MDPASTPARPRTDPFQILAEASDVAANHALDLEHLLRALERLIRKVVGYQLFAILLADDEGVLTIRHSIGYRADLAERLRVKPGEGITSTAILVGRNRSRIASTSSSSCCRRFDFASICTAGLNSSSPASSK
jgi:hypothetical protein